MRRLALLAITLLVAFAGSASARTTAAPTNTLPPTISGTPTEGQTLTVATGTWTSLATVTFTYEWYRCGFAGSPCVAIETATAATYTLTADDVGRTLRATVTATDTNGSNAATAAPTATVAALAPQSLVTAEELPTAIRAEDVVAPNTIAIDRVAVVPTRLTSRRAFKVRVHVMDTAKLDVAGAYVTVAGARIAAVGGKFTSNEGWSQFTLVPTKSFELKRGSLVLRVDVKPPVAGVDGPSAHRLVRVQIVPPRAATRKAAATKRS
jgi:hypothetical protein